MSIQKTKTKKGPDSKVGSKEYVWNLHLLIHPFFSETRLETFCVCVCVF